MDPATLIAALQQEIPGARIDPAPAFDLHPAMDIARDDVHAVCLALRDGPALRFALLAELTAIDFHPREPRFEVVYLLVSIEHRQRLRLRVRLAGADAHVATVCDVWPAANWLEREVWDLYGIRFDGHPDPRRLLMPEDWDGFPLRKDYPVQIRMTPRTAQPLQMTEEEFQANLLKDRLQR
jgi:NADH-quinone oxidoreductase subunit C